MEGVRRRTAEGGRGRLTGPAPLLLLACALSVAGCARWEVAVERDPAADFSRRATYEWIPLAALPPPDPGVDDPESATWLLAALNAELGLAGYRETTRAPDLRLSYRVGVTDRRGQTIWGFGFGARVPGAGSPVDSGSYRDAVLAFEARDGKTDRRLWRGSVHGLLLTGPEHERYLLQMVKEVLADFPPAAR